MQISNGAAALSSMSQMSHAQQAPEAKEGPGPDHDGDGDNVSNVSASPARSATPPGVGNTVDVSA